MLALKLTDVKDFMNKLLRSETFDNFLLQEAVISSAANYVIDGRVNQEYFSVEELEDAQIMDYPFLPFSMLRGNCFDLIKGKKTPASFRFVFLLSPENQKKTLESLHSSFTEKDIRGFFLNLKYQNLTLTLTTGVSYQIFSMDKSLENEWDKLAIRFLKQQNIAFEEL